MLLLILTPSYSSSFASHMSSSITLMFGMALGFTYKVLFSIFRMGGIVYYVPYCASPGIFSIVNMLFFVIQICCLVAQAPSNTKKKVRGKQSGERSGHANLIESTNATPFAMSGTMHTPVYENNENEILGLASLRRANLFVHRRSRLQAIR